MQRSSARNLRLGGGAEARAVRAVTGLAGGAAAYTEASGGGLHASCPVDHDCRHLSLAAATVTAPFSGELSLSGRICIRGRGRNTGVGEGERLGLEP